LEADEAPIPTQQSTLAVNSSDAVSTVSSATENAVSKVSSATENAVENATSAVSHAADKVNILHASSTPPTQSQIAHDILPQPPADAVTPSIEQLLAANPDNISAVINSPEAIHAAMRVGDMHLMGLTHGMFNFAGWLRDALEIIHVNAGLPWWGTIALAAGVMRLALFPLVARMHGNNARMQVIAPQQQVIMAKIQDASKRGDKGAQMIYSQELRKLWEINNCSPFRTMLLPMVQVPLFMTFFFAIRGMTSLPVPQLKEGGVLWFTDLVAADPYYILPTTSMLLTLAVLEVSRKLYGRRPY
jgi:YidC/Oxa1 family membrane protein insertase